MLRGARGVKHPGRLGDLGAKDAMGQRQLFDLAYLSRTKKTGLISYQKGSS